MKNAIDDASIPPYNFDAHGKRFTLTCERGSDAYEFAVRCGGRLWKGETPIVSLNVAENVGDMLRPMITGVFAAMETHIRDMSPIVFEF